MEDLTRTNPTGDSGDDSRSFDEARFAPGVVLAERYRIVGLLGSGGMGEVYRADDLKLGVSVALKFLPESFAQQPERLARFHSEVRTARSIAHANICRVYDIVEADGYHFISMEYIDGDDLESLLRRVGRLSGDKTVDLIRQLCMGVAAAHEAGILHRDLKPANIMIDGRGKVRITDFGLAGLADQMAGANVRAGTPAYMAPEQFERGEVSIQSDLYALGLVMYEMVTGKRTFSGKTLDDYRRMHASETPTSPSSVTSEIDPALERIIMACLSKDPTERPKSAMAVAAALPGADPLQAALAAGETPSPELVAAAGSSQGIHPGLGLGVTIWCLVSLIAFVIVTSQYRLYENVPLDEHPRVLAAKAREHIRAFGITEEAPYRAYRFTTRMGFIGHLRRGAEQPPDWGRIARETPPVVVFWYRESPTQFVPTNWFQRVIFDDPPRTQPGMTSLRVDTQGRLNYFHSVPERHEPEAEPGNFEWQQFFDAAGLEFENFEPVEPEWTPPSFCDERAAWTGQYPEQDDYPIRIEAGLHNGYPVYFEVIEPWYTPGSSGGGNRNVTSMVIGMVLLSLAGIALVAACVLAWSHVKHGRGDRRGAARLAMYLFIINLLYWALTGHHSTDLQQESTFVTRAAGFALLFAMFIWLAYMAIEPYVRKRWPTTLISWARLLSGRWADPLVARDLLYGMGYGLAWVWVWLIPHLESPAGQPPTHGSLSNQLLILDGPRYWFGMLLAAQLDPIFVSMAMLLLIFVLRTLLRSEWLAVTVFIVLLSAQNIAQNWQHGAYLSMAGSIFIFVTMFWVLWRYGLLCLIVANVMVGLLLSFPVTTDPQAWYFGSTAFLVVVLLGLMAFALIKSLAGRSLVSLAGD